MTKQMVDDNPVKQEFFNKLNYKYYSYMRLHWF